MEHRTTFAGTIILAAACVLFGMLSLRFGRFAEPWQVVPALHPSSLLLLTGGLLFIAGGLGLPFRRTRRLAGAALTIVFSTFAFGWLLKALAAPFVENFWSGFAEQMVLVLAALALSAKIEDRSDQLRTVVRLLLGLCLIAFGVTHFIYLPETAAMVPGFLPGPARGWAALTGICHCSGGVAIMLGRFDRLAALLLAAMFILFGALVWFPLLLASPDEHQILGGNTMNLALVGAMLITVEAVCRRRASSRSPTAPPFRAVPAA